MRRRKRTRRALTTAPNVRHLSPENPTVSLSSWVDGFMGIPSYGSVHVTPETAPALSAVFAAWRILGETVGSLKCNTYELDGSGGENIAYKHPTNYIVSREPNPYYSSMTFFESETIHLAARGNAYAKINRNRGGQVTGLDILDSARVQPLLKDDGSLIYAFNDKPDSQKGFLPDEILHVPFMAMDGIVSRSPIVCAAQTIGLGLSTQNYGTSLFENGAFLTGVLKHPKSLNKEKLDRLKESWATSYSSAVNSGKTAILEDGMEFQPIRLSPHETQFIEAMKFTVEEVARIYRIPQHLLQSLDKSSFNNIETQSIEFIMYTIRPYVKRFEHELNRKLLTRKEQERFRIRFNLDSLLRGDTKTRGEFYHKLWSIGAMSPNEIRRLENLNPYEGGDEYFVPLNYSNGNGDEDI